METDRNDTESMETDLDDTESTPGSTTMETDRDDTESILLTTNFGHENPKDAPRDPRVSRKGN